MFDRLVFVQHFIANAEKIRKRGITVACDNKELALLRGVVRAVAKNGLENTTTRSIGAESGIDDAYIYRFYRDKEALLCQAFLLECDRFVERILQAIGMLRRTNLAESLEDRSRFVIACVWNYLKSEPDISLFFVRYYHSVSFQNHASKQYQTHLSRIRDSLTERLLLRDNALLILNHMLESLFSFAAKVAGGSLADDENTANIVFSQLYGIFQNALGAEQEI